MTRDRMVRSEWYQDGPGLLADRRRCWRALNRFNATGPEDDEERWEILAGLFGSLGAGTVVLPRFQCSYGPQIRVGVSTFINSDVLFMDDASIVVGDDVLIGPRVQLLTALHPVEDHERRRAGWERALPIAIGANSWLGAGVIVCPGVSIGSEVVVGAGSVVTRDVEDRVFVAGNPARVVRPL
ncbi:sugar O-acetyltransferase [Actinokineospora enzanensis]|uniref:sugar O-acetyltransferase n=1 Tax=Actinokineospora enzanensis TaxID=155975 RepID=UPI00037D620B|nr:sugar O-acetyltransferase [Actinokineospora enzanensis]